MMEHNTMDRVIGNWGSRIMGDIAVTTLSMLLNSNQIRIKMERCIEDKMVIISKADMAVITEVFKVIRIVGPIGAIEGG